MLPQCNLLMFTFVSLLLFFQPTSLLLTARRLPLLVTCWLYTRVKRVVFRLEIFANFQIFYTVLDSKLIALISKIIIKIKN